MPIHERRLRLLMETVRPGQPIPLVSIDVDGLFSADCEILKDGRRFQGGF